MPRLASTTARGYGAAHQAERKRWAKVIETYGHRCWRCHRMIVAGMAWDLGHDDNDRSRYQGPEHRHCNRSAGGRKGNRARRGTSVQW